MGKRVLALLLGYLVARQCLAKLASEGKGQAGRVARGPPPQEQRCPRFSFICQHAGGPQREWTLRGCGPNASRARTYHHWEPRTRGTKVGEWCQTLGDPLPQSRGGARSRTGQMAAVYGKDEEELHPGEGQVQGQPGPPREGEVRTTSSTGDGSAGTPELPAATSGYFAAGCRYGGGCSGMGGAHEGHHSGRQWALWSACRSLWRPHHPTSSLPHSNAGYPCCPCRLAASWRCRDSPQPIYEAGPYHAPGGPAQDTGGRGAAPGYYAASTDCFSTAGEIGPLCDLAQHVDGYAIPGFSPYEIPPPNLGTQDTGQVGGKVALYAQDGAYLFGRQARATPSHDHRDPDRRRGGGPRRQLGRARADGVALSRWDMLYEAGYDRCGAWLFRPVQAPPAPGAGLITSCTACRRRAVPTTQIRAALMMNPRQQAPRPGLPKGDSGLPGRQPWFDILDFQEFALAVLYRGHRLFLLSAPPSLGGELCFIVLAAELYVLLVHVRWHRPLAASKRGAHRHGWSQVLLGYAVLLTTAAAAPTRQAALKPGTGPRVPATAALDLWCSGQQTLGEQLAEALQRHALSLPLTSGGLDPPNVYRDGPPHLGRHEPEPIQANIHDEDLGIHEQEQEATTHISFLVFTPYFMTETVDIAMTFPLQADRTLEFVNESVHLIDKPWLSEMIFTSPQLYDECGSIVRLPAWVPLSDKFALVYDATRVDRGVFAGYHQGPVTRDKVLRAIGVDPAQPVEVFAFGSLAPLADAYPAWPVQAGVIRILPRGEAPYWPRDISDRLNDPDHWDPRAEHPLHRGGKHIAFQTEEVQYLHQVLRGQTTTPLQVACEAFGLTADNIWLRSPTERPLALSWQGQRVHSFVAVAEEARHPKDSTRIVTMDLRGVGMWPQWVSVTGDGFCPGDYLEALQIQVVDGFTLVVLGGVRSRHPGILHVADGELLEVVLQRTTQLSPSSSTSPSSSSHHEDPDDEFDDPVPGSSEFSDSPPHGPGPHGPPPPAPQNRPRSRSPRTRTRDPDGPQPDLNVPRQVRLFDALPIPEYDLTLHRLPFPHQAEHLARLLRPWPLSWLNFDLAEVAMKAVTRQALQQSPTWQQLVSMRPVGEPVQFHLYTDGSSDPRRGRSGYSVIILLQIGLVSALLGIIGGALDGNASSPWPTSSNAALRSEQIALTAATLWALQFAPMLKHATCHVHFDCFAAGWSTTGAWKAPDDISVKLHHLEMFSRDYVQGGLRFQHVRAHAADPWNELADVVAKAVSKQQLQLCTPPLDTCRAYLDTDWSWLATDLQARLHGTLPVQDGELAWSPSQASFDPVSPLPRAKLVPTIAETWGTPTKPASFALSVATLNAQGIAGKYKYYEEQLLAQKNNILFLQEHEGHSQFCLSKAYTRLHTEGLKHWGVGIWLSRQLGTIILDSKPRFTDEADILVKFESERLLVTEINLGGGKLLLASAHCPYGKRNPAAAKLLEELENQLQAGRDAQLIIVGLDLNGRLPGHHESVSGDLTHGTPDYNGQLAAELCARLHLWAPSTFAALHRGTSSTYTHPLGGQHRIDFLFIGGRARCHQLRSEVVEDFDTMNHNDDHRLVSLTLAGEWRDHNYRARLWRPRFDIAKLRTPEGKALVARELEQYIPPTWQTHPDTHCQHLQEFLQDILQKHFRLPHNPPKTSYMPDQVWEWRRQKLRLRARTRPRKQIWTGLRAKAFQSWRQNAALVTGGLLTKTCLMHGIISMAIKFITFAMKREIRRAKEEYLRQAAKGPEPQTAANHMLRNLKKAGLGKQTLRPFSRQLPLLLDDSQSPATTRAERDQLWLSHFGKQECGDIVQVADLLRDPHPPICRDDDIVWSLDMLPSRTELEDMFRRAPHDKAAGLDAIPGELLKASPSQLARAAHTLTMKAVMALRQPLQWRGGVLYSAWKRNGDRTSAESHRSLFVSSLLAKSLHRLMKDKVTDLTEATLHPLHFGSRRGAPVTFPAIYILAHQRDAIAKGESSGILFLDTKAAYYRVAREVAVGKIVDDAVIAHVFKHFQLDPQDIHELYEVIQAGGVMGDVSMPVVARHAAKDYHHRAWFATSYCDGSKVCLTRAGSRPGESWADCVFAFVYSKVLYYVAELVKAEGLIDAIDYDCAAGIFGGGHSGEPIYAVDGTWADDSAFPLRDQRPATLLAKAARLTSIVLTRCQELGMQPNLNKGKTALLLRVQGKGSQQAKRQYFPTGKPHLWLQDLQVSVAIEPVYTHLGGVLDHRGTMFPEAQRRLAIATAALEDGKALIYTNKTIGLQARVSVFEAAIRPTFFNVSLWLPAGPAWEKLTAGYTRLLKKLLATHFRGDSLFGLPGPLVHILTNSFPLELVATKARMSFLCSLAQSGPPELWAALQREQTWLGQRRKDLSGLVVDSPETWPGLSEAFWPAWRKLLTLSAPWFKKQVQQRLLRDFARYIGQQRQYLALWSLHKLARQFLPQPDKPPPSWYCRVCHVWFPKKAALGVHMFKVHQRKAAYRRGAIGTVCRACGKNFWADNRLVLHLRSSQQCVQTMRRWGIVAEEMQAGIGSRRWKQRDVEQYTLSMPVQVQPELPAAEDEHWDPLMLEAHASICDVLLTKDLPMDPEGIQLVLHEALKHFPLYDDEVVTVLEYLLNELREVKDACLEEYWSAGQYDHIVQLVGELLDNPSPPPPTQPTEDGQIKFKAFVDSLETLDWDSLLLAATHGHVTKKFLVIILIGDLEAAWALTGDELLNAAVADFQSCLVPTPLRQAWTKALQGEPIQVLALPQFWSLPVSKPFVSFGGCPICTS